MKERPILFSGPMVRALLSGAKSQTRRIVKFRDCNDDHSLHNVWRAWNGKSHDWQDRDDIIRCPYGVAGDRLWVRETWTADFAWPEESGHPRILPWEKTPAAFRGPKNCTSVYYAADRVEWHPPVDGVFLAPREDQPTDDEWEAVRFRPSIHMPRWASRLTLEVTGVRVERVQDISGADAFAEGVQVPVSEPNRPLLCLTSRIPFEVVSAKHPKEWGRDEYARFEYAQLWNTINGAGSWESNPWVWVVEFARVAR